MASTITPGQQAHVLDHLIWNALTSKQRRFAVGNEQLLRFDPQVGPFAALAGDDVAPDAMRRLAMQYGSMAFSTRQALPAVHGLPILRQATLTQMVWQGDVSMLAAAQPNVALTQADIPEMLALVAATEPGPFGPCTIELGHYLGIHKNGQLAAMAGERMQVEGFTEISAVCVDPAYRGKGLAAALMSALITAICARGQTPFLHVFPTNAGAIKLYRALGFVARADFHLTVVGAPSQASE